MRQIYFLLYITVSTLIATTAFAGHLNTIKPETSVSAWENASSPVNATFNQIYAVEGKPNIVLASTMGENAKSRLYRSTNGGISWNQVFINPSHELFYLSTIKNISGQLYASVYNQPVNSVTKFYVSNDGGASWKLATNLPNGTTQLAGNVSTLYAIANSSSGKELYTSTSSGLTWTKHTVPPEAFSSGNFKIFYSNGALYIYNGMNSIFKTTNNGASYTKIALPHLGYSDLVNDVLSYGSNLFIATDSSGVLKTSDNGTSWSSVTTLAMSKKTYRLKEVNSKLILLTANGLYISNNLGQSWYALRNLKGFIIQAAFAVLGNTLYLGNPDIGLLKSKDLGLNWSTMSNTINPYAYAFVTGPSNTYMSSGEKLYAQSSSSNHWQAFPNNLTGGSLPLFSENGTLYVLSENSQLTFDIYKTTNSGLQWTKVNLPHTYSTMMPPPYTVPGGFIDDNGTLYVNIRTMTGSIDIEKSLNGGKSWSVVATAPKGTGFTYLSSKVWLAIGTQSFYKSVDQGKTWTPIALPGTSRVNNYNITPSLNMKLYGNIFYMSETLPSGKYSPAQSYILTINLLSNKINVSYSGQGYISNFAAAGGKAFIYADLNGTTGIYEATDSSKSWQKISGPIPAGLATTIYIKNNTLYVGTASKGIYKANLNLAGLPE